MNTEHSLLSRGRRRSTAWLAILFVALGWKASFLAQALPLVLRLTDPLPHATVGVHYDQVVGTGTGGSEPYHFQLGTAGGFPAIGIIMDIDGRLTGTPKTPGTYRFVVSLVDLGGHQNNQNAVLIVDPPSFSISNVAAPEGNTGSGIFKFDITLRGKTNKTAIVTYDTVNGTAHGAKAGGAGVDYQSVFATRVTFLPGQTRKTVKVIVFGDRTVEANETFFVRLSKPINATISKAVGTGTIRNDDAPQLTLTLLKSGKGGGTLTADPPGPSYAKGTTVHLTATPNSDSVFAGWKGATSETGQATITMNANTSVTAIFNIAPITPPAIHITSVDKTVTDHNSLWTDYSVTVHGTTTGTPNNFSYEAGWGNFGVINNTLSSNPENWSFNFTYTQFAGPNDTIMPIWADVYDISGTVASDQTTVTLPY